MWNTLHCFPRNLMTSSNRQLVYIVHKTGQTCLVNGTELPHIIPPCIHMHWETAWWVGDNIVENMGIALQDYVRVLSILRVCWAISSGRTKRKVSGRLVINTHWIQCLQPMSEEARVPLGMENHFGIKSICQMCCPLRWGLNYMSLDDNSWQLRPILTQPGLPHMLSNWNL